MTVISFDEAPRFSAGGTNVIGLAAPTRGASETCAWRFTLDPGSSSPSHSLDREEIVIALEGRLDADLDGERSTLGPGDALIIPAGCEVVLANPGPQPFEAIACLPVGAQASVEGEASVPPWAA